MDTRPRKITEEQKGLLSSLADHLIQHAESKVATLDIAPVFETAS